MPDESAPDTQTELALDSAPEATPALSVFGEIDAMAGLGGSEASRFPNEEYTPPASFEEINAAIDPVVVPAPPAPAPEVPQVPVETPTEPVAASAPVEATTTPPAPETVPKEQYDALMEMLNQMSGGQPQQAPAPANVVQIQPTPQNVQPAAPVAAAPVIPVTPPAPVQLAPMQFVTPENHDAILTDPNALNSVLTQAASYAVQQAMNTQYGIAATAAQHAVRMESLTNQFYQANPALANIPWNVIRRMGNELASQNPAWNDEQVFLNLGKYATDRLKLATKQQAVAPARPTFAPQPAANNTQASNPRTDRSTIQDELDRMALIP